MFTSNTEDSTVSQTDVKQKFIISSISQLISDSKDLVFTKLLLIECIECQQRFDNLLDNYKHFLDRHKVNDNAIEINDKPKRMTKRSINLETKENNRKVSEDLSDNRPEGQAEIGTTEKRYICDVKDCGKSFTRQYGLTKHMRTHFGKGSKDNICGYKGCPKAYTYRCDLVKHMRIHSNPIVCDICGKGFSTNTTLKTHKIIHSEDKPHACQWPGCEYRARIKAQVDSHMRTHTKEKPFKCDFEGCSRKYGSQTAVKEHILRFHTKIKNHPCNWPGCESKFCNATELKTHMTTHTNERPFSCDWPDCEKRFSNSDILKKHKRTHTGERPYHCLIDGCTASFSCRGTLGTHKKRIHKCNEIKRSRWDRPKNPR